MKDKISFATIYITFLSIIFIFSNIWIYVKYQNVNEKPEYTFYQMCIEGEIVELQVVEKSSEQNIKYYKLNESCDWGIKK